MKNHLLKYLFFLLFIAACAPLHIREHQAATLKESTGQIQTSKSNMDGGLYYSIQSQNIRGNLSALSESNKKDFMKVSMNFVGRKGAFIKINHQVLKYRYSGKDWQTVEGKISSQQWNWDYGVPNGGKEFSVVQPQFNKDYIFSMEDKKGNEERLTFSVVIPKKEEDLEIEIPEIFLEGKLLYPKNLIFKWNDRWTLSPING